MSRQKLLLKTIGVILATLLLAECGAPSTPIPPTATPYPTLTPYPTVTPYPTNTPFPTYTPLPSTATPVPPAWNVKLTSVTTNTQFGDYEVTDKGTKTQFIIITLEYTYQGQERVTFSPESVVLAYTGQEGFTGWAKLPTLYRPDDSSNDIDFDTAAQAKYLSTGANHTDVFVWQFNKDYKEFMLYFPGTDVIEITVE